MSEQLRTQAGWDEAIVTGVDWVSTFRVHRRLATSYRRRRVPLAGDAAHIHAPFGGQGMNTGIGDAENLAWKLALVAGGLAGTALLDTYEAERRPIATDVLSSTSSLTEMRFGDGAVARALRDHVVLPLLDRPRVQRSIAEKSSQLGVSYRGGPLARRRWTLAGALGRRVEPGDRVADRTCRRSDGTTTRLNAELGPGWVLLTAAGIAAPECAAVAAGRLGDDRVIHLRSDDERSGDVLLVRPDGHLAWRGTDPASLGQWLGEALRGGDERTPMASSAASRGKRPTADARG